MSQISEATFCTRASLYSYIGDVGARSYPEHSTGERLLVLWMERTGCKREDAPMWRRPLSVSAVLKAHR